MTSPMRSPSTRAKEENINQAVTDRFSGLWASNAKANSFAYKGKKINNVRNYLPKVKNAIVAGSGPSLTASIPLIKEHRDKLCVFSTDTAFPVLYNNGIIPDFCATIDPSPSLVRCFQFMKGKPKVNTILLFSCLAAPEVRAVWRGDTMMFVPHDPQNKVINELGDTYFRGFGKLVSRMNVGDFLVNTACMHFQYPNVAFAGIDFCYINGMTYAEGVLHTDPTQYDKSRVINTKNAKGEDVETTRLFLTYAASFNEVAEKVWHTKRTLYNLSNGLVTASVRDAEAFRARLE